MAGANESSGLVYFMVLDFPYFVCSPTELDLERPRYSGAPGIAYSSASYAGMLWKRVSGDMSWTTKSPLVPPRTAETAGANTVISGLAYFMCITSSLSSNVLKREHLLPWLLPAFVTHRRRRRLACDIPDPVRQNPGCSK
jgi:hypothetical protein